MDHQLGQTKSSNYREVARPGGWIILFPIPSGPTCGDLNYVIHVYDAREHRSGVFRAPNVDPILGRSCIYLNDTPF